MNKRRLPILLLLLLAIVAGCSAQKVDEAHVGVRYTDGMFDGKKFEKVVQPGGTEWTFNDNVYQLPAGQRSYIVSSKADVGDRAGNDFLVITTKDGTRLRIELNTRFFLNIREEPLKDFFLKICQKYDCWNDTPEKPGWDKMLAENFRVPLETVSSTIGFKYEGSALRYSAELWDQFGTEFAKAFTDEQVKILGRGDYFCGPGYAWDKPDTGCPPLPVSITSVRFDNDELESIPDQRKQAVEKKALAKEQEAAEVARAGVQVAYANALKGAATPEVIALQQAEAMKKCAENPQGCTLIINQGSRDATVAVSPGQK